MTCSLPDRTRCAEEAGSSVKRVVLEKRQRVRASAPNTLSAAVASRTLPCLLDELLEITPA